jgi:hypothetical protein
MDLVITMLTGLSYLALELILQPAILVADQVKTKRQGQNWGQERSSEKHKSQGWAETIGSQSFEGLIASDKARNQNDPATFEKHPVLSGKPQVYVLRTHRRPIYMAKALL